VIFKFGNYSHRVDSTGTQFECTPIMDFRQEAWALTYRWPIEFRLINAGQSSKDMDSAITTLENAYKQTATSAALLHDDGTPTVHSLSASNTIGGIRVVKPPSYMKYQNGEYVTYRTGSIVLEAMVKLTDDAYRIIDFSESIDMEGGGPEFAHLQPNVGFAVKQQTRTATKFIATQSGRIVHLGAYGPVPPPLWPSAQMRPVKLRAESPKYVGDVAHSFPTSYTYQFEAPAWMAGEPTRIV